ncbi:hypothetical protein LWC34_38835 [Kibdelosporangium philippinense]|uniref:Hemolysin XhlA n=1 Tax=Kibdelosporangium philippinense TaxID=211113 RepID=A0ABS8ZQ25_9PSEU|nr:hypothetical protein [Kibdelosporangium philippinense]MCE7008726.1 hypothetical protein [Kibdelosporangium philippinense]
MSEELVTDRLTRIETKLDLALTQHREELNDHETRIRKLERALWIAAGFAATAGGGVGAVISQIMGGA